MSWRRVPVSGLENADDAMFCGLEEIDYNDYLKLKKDNKATADVHIGDEDMEPPTSTITYEEALRENDESNELAKPEGKPKKNGKEKRQTSIGGGVEDLGEDDYGDSSTRKTKRKKRKSLVENDNSAYSSKTQRREDQTSLPKGKKKSETDSTLSSKRVGNVNDDSMDANQNMGKIDSEKLILTPWGSMVLPFCLVKCLKSLGYVTPTPIQSMVVPVIMKGASDIVGAAVTGSGKTLAFAIPIVCEILYNWAEIRSTKKPFSIVFTPTRELAMQISSVVKGIVHHEEMKAALGNKRRVEVINIIGGMSEQKQQRELSGTRPAHIIIATPGRLCELLKDSDNMALRDLSMLRTLVIDEADRMIEEGHFDELFKIFTVIKEHENFRAEGRDPYRAKLEEMKGEYYNDEEDDEAMENTKNTGEDDNMGVIEDMEVEEDEGLMMMPEHLMTEEERKKSKVGFSWNEQSGHLDEAMIVTPQISKRQTLLFSATVTKLNNAATILKQSNESKKKTKKNKKDNTSELDKLPDHIHRLLQLIGIKKKFQVVDASQKLQSDSNIIADSSSNVVQAEDEGAVLPIGLTQKEIRVTADEKDTAVYYFLRKITGRTLIFVNAIITAKRLDGLLRSLGFNCRCIHGQLEQKQRFRALETFRSAPIAMLVATDVAARGLDIPRVSTVVHYDIARTPQAYIHRSGRTARTNKDGAAVGTAISVVSPEDIGYHNEIQQVVPKSKFINLKVDPSVMDQLDKRVRLAKKVITHQSPISTSHRNTNQSNDASYVNNL